MFASARLKYLHERKQQLLVQCDVQRRLWAMECAEVRQRLAWLDRMVTTARGILPWCGLAVPLWRLWSSRRAGAGKSWLGKLAALLPVARQFAEVWRLFSQRRDDDTSVASRKEQAAPDFSKRTAA